MGMVIQQDMKTKKENMFTESVMKCSKVKSLKDFTFAITATIENVLIPIICGLVQPRTICKMQNGKVG